MNTSQLYSFIVVAQNENLSKAASMLYVSQSTLSKNIAKLEEELGVKLFDRRGKKIVLNKQGERFLESSIGILRDIETATQDLRALSNGSGGRLRIGCPGEILPLCDCVSEFCREHPDTYVEIDASIETLDYIEMSNYEMLIYPNGPQFDKLEGYRFCNERYLVVLNSDHPLAARETLGFSDLMDERFVFVRRDQTHPEFAYRLCGAQGLRVSQQLFVSSAEMHLQIIRNGTAMGLVSDLTRRQYDEDPAIAVRELTDCQPTRPLFVCFKRSPTLQPIENSFKDFVIEYFGIDTSTTIGGKRR